MIHTPYAMNSTGQPRVLDKNDYLQFGGYLATSDTPTIAAGPALGTSPTISIEGTNSEGLITLKTGLSLLTVGKVLTLTLSTGFVYPTRMTVTFTAHNANFATLLSLLYLTCSQGSTDLNVTSVLSINTTYVGLYRIGGY